MLLVIFSLVTLFTLIQLEMGPCFLNFLLAIASVPVIYGAFKEVFIYLALHLFLLFLKVVYIFVEGYQYKAETTNTGLNSVSYVLLVIFVLDMIATFSSLLTLFTDSVYQRI